MSTSPPVPPPDPGPNPEPVPGPTPVPRPVPAPPPLPDPCDGEGADGASMAPGSESCAAASAWAGIFTVGIGTGSAVVI